MEKIKQIIQQTAKSAVIEENKIFTVTAEPKEARALLAALYSNEALPFDYLKYLTGKDNGETLGVEYLLSSSIKPDIDILIKTAADNRSNPLLYSVADLYETAQLNEREVYAMFGIRFINNPDMRRFLLNDSWKGFPLRKDYDSNPELNKFSIVSQEPSDIAPRIMETPEGGLQESRVNIFEKDDYIINIGPQHPSTHGVMHFRTALDGEIVKKIDVHSGYIHRGIEKLCESMTYPQILHFTDRLDYLSANINRHALCMCVEKAAEIEVPERAKYIRTIMDELNRIDSHLLAWAAQTNDLGATTAFIYGMREREAILSIFEKTCGGRLIINQNVIGGCMFDIYNNFQKDIKDFIILMRKRLKEYDSFFSHNVIALGRMINIGNMTKKDAISYAVTGPAGRASGWSCDVRKYQPYALYDKVEFKEIIRTEGDSYARYLNRLDEIEESLKIVEQLIDNIPEGDICAKTKAIIKLPEGEYFQNVEAGKGLFGVYIESRGEKTPYRLKFRSPSMALVSIMPLICRGEKLSDLIGIGGSMDYVIPDIDR
ncbi:MAG: NADH-quinone oxidoreductase subunit D, partial [Prevotellaceae bacterium]|jgi:NADH-quinone oxidoreductase subunit C/D|nr:NADH-quinone oxidoreductase subunit D [Prevotellaceae bacterium]